MHVHPEYEGTLARQHAHGYLIRMKRTRIVLSALCCLLGLCLSSGCTRVAFNQKALLGDDMMLFDHDEVGTDIQNHVLTPREASVGGFSAIGAGGCGCN